MSDASSSTTVGEEEATGVFVANLPRDVKKDDLKEFCNQAGMVLYVDIKRQEGTRVGLPFGFVEYLDESGATNAVATLNGKTFGGRRIVVEHRRKIGWNNAVPLSNDGRSYNNKSTCRTNHKIHVSGLPKRMAWQDLKDHFRVAGRVAFALILRPGYGLVEFQDEASMTHAIRSLDGSIIPCDGKRHRLRVKRFISMEEHRSRTQHYRGRTRSRSRSPRGRRRSRRTRSRSPPSACGRAPHCCRPIPGSPLCD